MYVKKQGEKIMKTGMNTMSFKAVKIPLNEYPTEKQDKKNLHQAIRTEGNFSISDYLITYDDINVIIDVTNYKNNADRAAKELIISDVLNKNNIPNKITKQQLGDC